MNENTKVAREYRMEKGILINNGSTHSFIDSSIVKTLGNTA